MNIACPVCGAVYTLQLPNVRRGRLVFGFVCVTCGARLVGDSGPQQVSSPSAVVGTGQPTQGGSGQQGTPTVSPAEAGGGASQVQPTPDAVKSFASQKILVGICAIVVGWLGIHKFILGFQRADILMLLASIIGGITGLCYIFFWAAPLAMWVIGLVEGILYLTKSDEEFYQLYAIEKREWF